MKHIGNKRPFKTKANKPKNLDDEHLSIIKKERKNILMKKMLALLIHGIITGSFLKVSLAEKLSFCKTLYFSLFFSNRETVTRDRD